MTDYSKFYNLENYLFTEVHDKFTNNGYLDAFDFFCIVIWKANRAKTKIVDKLGADLESACKNLTQDIYNAKSNEDKVRVLLGKWKFRIPMASAILTVLYPDDYTVYDVRVCEVLGKYMYLADKKVDDVITGYFDFIEDVKRKVPEKDKLRDKDRYLWAKSFYGDLVKFVES